MAVTLLCDEAPRTAVQILATHGLKRRLGIAVEEELLVGFADELPVAGLLRFVLQPVRDDHPWGIQPEHRVGRRETLISLCPECGGMWIGDQARAADLRKFPDSKSVFHQ